MNLEFFKELETVLSLLEKLAQRPEWGRCCNRALDDGEMTLGDALQAVRWIVGFENDDVSLVSFSYSNYSIPEKLSEIFAETCYDAREYDDDDYDFFSHEEDRLLYDNNCTSLNYKGFPILIVENYEGKFFYYLSVENIWQEWPESILNVMGEFDLESTDRVLTGLYKHLDELCLSVISDGQLSLFATA